MICLLICPWYRHIVWTLTSPLKSALQICIAKVQVELPAKTSFFRPWRPALEGKFNVSQTLKKSDHSFGIAEFGPNTGPEISNQSEDVTQWWAVRKVAAPIFCAFDLWKKPSQHLTTSHRNRGWSNLPFPWGTDNFFFFFGGATIDNYP